MRHGPHKRLLLPGRARLAPPCPARPSPAVPRQAPPRHSWPTADEQNRGLPPEDRAEPHLVHLQPVEAEGRASRGHARDVVAERVVRPAIAHDPTHLATGRRHRAHLEGSVAEAGAAHQHPDRSALQEEAVREAAPRLVPAGRSAPDVARRDRDGWQEHLGLDRLRVDVVRRGAASTDPSAGRITCAELDRLGHSRELLDERADELDAGGDRTRPLQRPQPDGVHLRRR